MLDDVRFTPIKKITPTLAATIAIPIDIAFAILSFGPQLYHRVIQ